MCHLGLLQRFPSKIIGWKNWVQKLLEVVKTPNKPNQRPQIQLSRTVRPVGQQPFTQKIEKDVLFGRDGTKNSSYKSQKIRGDRWSKDEGRKSSLMDICHLKNAELETEHQKYKGRVVLRGDIVKDDLGSYAVFTEQGSSMTAAKVMDIISRLPGCLGQAADASNICLHPGKDGRCSQIIKNSQIGMSRHLDSSTTTQMASIMSSMEDPVVPLELNLYGHPSAGLLWERLFEKILLKYGWGRFPIGNADSYTVKKGYSYLCMWMTSNWLERNKTLIRCGKYSIKKLIWENPHLS